MIIMKKIRIISAAIKIVDLDTWNEQFVYWKRHWYCRFLINQWVFKKPKNFKLVDWFIDQDLKFYDRKEAWKIVVHNGQLRRLDDDYDVIDYDKVDECDSIYLWWDDC